MFVHFISIINDDCNLPVQNGKLYSYPTKTTYGDDSDADESIEKHFCMTYRGRFYYSLKRKDGSTWLGCCDKQSKWNYPFYLQGLTDEISHLNYNDQNTVVTLSLKSGKQVLVEATQHRRDHARPRTFSWSYFEVRDITKSNFKNPSSLTDSCAIFDEGVEFDFMGKDRTMHSLLNQIKEHIPDESINSDGISLWRNQLDSLIYETRPKKVDYEVNKVENYKEEEKLMDSEILKLYDDELNIPDNLSRKKPKVKDIKLLNSPENADHITYKRAIWKTLISSKISPNFSSKSLIHSLKYAISINNYTAALEIYQLYKKTGQKYKQPKLTCNMIGRPDQNLLMDVACDSCTKYWTGENKFVDLWIYDVPGVGMISGEGACVQCMMGNLQTQFSCTKNLPGNDGHQWFCDTKNDKFANKFEVGSQKDRERLFLEILKYEPEYLLDKVWFMNGQLLVEVLLDLYIQQKFEQLQFCIKYGEYGKEFRDPVSRSSDVLHKDEFPSPPFFLEWALKQIIRNSIKLFVNEKSKFDMIILDKIVNAALSFNSMDEVLVDFIRFPVIQESLMRVFILLDEDKDKESDELPENENAIYWTRRHLQNHTFGTAAKTKAKITKLLTTSFNGPSIISSSELLEKQILTAEKFLKQIRLSIVKPIRPSENQFDPIGLHNFYSRRSEHLLDRIKSGITELKYITYDRDDGGLGHNDAEAVKMSKCLKTCQFIVPNWKKQPLRQAYGAAPGTKQPDSYVVEFEEGLNDLDVDNLFLENYRVPSEISQVQRILEINSKKQFFQKSTFF